MGVKHLDYTSGRKERTTHTSRRHCPHRVNTHEVCGVLLFITDDNAPELDGGSSCIKAKHLGPDYVMTKTGHYELRDVCRWARESDAAVRAEVACCGTVQIPVL
ncbi:hypothetical protein J6590_061941 [Homalodisca vitripennis]|nr:hypothetical protein J6590_061941 [Homalodisca vitripennis]